MADKFVEDTSEFEFNGIRTYRMRDSAEEGTLSPCCVPEESTAVAVFVNVVNILGILHLGGMIVFGGIFFNDCPQQPMLSISMIVQGGLSIMIPALCIIKFRFRVPMKKTCFYTIFVTLVILSICWLIAFTSWLASADCHEVILFKACVGFGVILWIFVLVSTVTVVVWWCCLRNRPYSRQASLHSDTRPHRLTHRRSL